MPPTRVSQSQNKQPNAMIIRNGITTRNQKALANNVNVKVAVAAKDPRLKRKADASPLKDKMTKRSALGNITNAIGKSMGVQLPETRKNLKRGQLSSQIKLPIISTNILKNNEKISLRSDNAIQLQKPKITTKVLPIKLTVNKNIDKQKTEVIQKKLGNLRRSIDTEKSNDSSLYVSALEDVSEGSAKKIDQVHEKIDEEKEPIDDNDNDENLLCVKTLSIAERLDATPIINLPDGVQWNFDAENWHDPYQVSQYAMEIFIYMKGREKKFPISDYMERQVCLSRWMRSLLIDWMVEVQESFELNHETLYLAVKLVDLYLSKVTVGKETLQLLGAASLFIASKYDERIPPMVEDFLYICDGAYTQRELIRMEMNVLKIVDFDLGIPLSYRFLRRYARCAKVSMPTLTLARFILEYSLMDYSTIMFSDSKIAAAALLLALQMKDLGGWSSILEYYTSYNVDDVRDIINVLNDGLHRTHKDALSTVRNKYSHKIFFEVAKVPLKNTLNI